MKIPITFRDAGEKTLKTMVKNTLKELGQSEVGVLVQGGKMYPTWKDACANEIGLRSSDPMKMIGFTVWTDDYVVVLGDNKDGWCQHDTIIAVYRHPESVPQDNTRE